ncbi:MAG: AMP-binding protein, partial [Candidatus Helarchaeota archaeon]|nr:AMP-binding protein [Candidatus Helarchaeota archaeon]
MDIPQEIKDKYWMKYAPPGFDKWIEIPDMTIPEMGENSAKKFGDNIIIDYFGREYTMKQMMDLSLKFSNGLAKLGVKKGDITAIFLPNCPQFIISYYGILSTGSYLTAISPLFVGREVKYQVNDSGSTTIIVLDRFFRHVKKIRAETNLKNIILVNIEGKIPKKPEDPENGIYHFDTIMDNPPKRPEIDFSPDDIAIIQYTGGTTGDPKGAMLTHRNVVSNAHQVMPYVNELKRFFKWERQIMVSVLPWYHIYGQTCELALNSLVGAKTYLFPTFDPGAVLEKFE